MNAEGQRRFMDELDRRCRSERLQGGSGVAACLQPKDAELLTAILHDPTANDSLQTQAAVWLAYLDDAEAVEAIAGWLEQPHASLRLNAIQYNRIPPLAKSARFVQTLLAGLDPAHSQWSQFLQIAGMQEIVEAQPRLEEILQAGQPVPEVHRLAYWVSRRNASLEMLEATLRYLDPVLEIPVREQPWAQLGAFAVAEPQRKRILEFLRNYGEPPGDYWWNFNYESMLCGLGDHSNLAEIEQLFSTSKRFNGSPAQALARIQGREAAPRLLTLLGDPRWSDQALRPLGTLLAGTGDAAAIAALSPLTSDDSRLPLVLETLLTIGGPVAKELVGAHIRRIPKEGRQALWWEYMELKLTVLAKLMTTMGATAVRDPADCRAKNPGTPDSQLVPCVFGDHLFSIDCESDEVPVPHDRLLERLADQLGKLGFRLDGIGQTATEPDEDDGCQYQIWFEFDGVHHAFPAQTKGDWYDIGAVMMQVQTGIERSRPDWSAFPLEASGQAIRFLVIPRKLRLALVGFGIEFVVR